MKQLSQQKNHNSYTLEFLASLTKSILIGDAKTTLKSAQSLDLASKCDISFISQGRYKSVADKSSAGAVIVPHNFNCKDGNNYLLSDNPSRAFQKILELFHKKKDHSCGISKKAHICPTAKLESGVSVAAGCIIQSGAQIGENTTLMPGVIIGQDVIIGANCKLFPSVVIQAHCIIGQRVILQPGAIIGSCGYGYFTNKEAKHEKIEHFGNVILEDDVEIGANTTVDRARFNSTIIGKGTKIDNLVQIGHNVVLGQNNLIVSQTGISGSTTTGNRVILGGQCGIVGHIHITDDVILAAKGGFSKSINDKGIYSGAPALPLQQYNRNSVQLRNIEKTLKNMKILEEKIDCLEKKLTSLEKTSNV